MMLSLLYRDWHRREHSSERLSTDRKGDETPPIHFRLIEHRTNQSNDMECLIICLFKAKCQDLLHIMALISKKMNHDEIKREKDS